MKSKSTLSHAAQVKLIKEAFDAIPDLQDGWCEVRDKLYQMNIEAERRHRRGPHARPSNFSAADGAKYFVVSHLLDGYEKPDRFKVDDILSIRNEVLYAQAYAKRFHTQLKSWAAKYAPQFAQVDYVALMAA